jgi:tellurite resistance protein
MTQQQPGRLAYFPPSFFAMIMGLGGFTLALEKAQGMWGLSPFVPLMALGFTSMVFLLLLGAFAYKLIKYPQELKADFNHPIRINFFPALSIALAILGMAWHPIAADFAAILWWSGALLHIAFTLVIVSSWMHHQHYQITHMNAAWFIPAAGNILMPILGVQIAGVEVSWFFFSVGLVLWIILQGIVFNRVIFHDPLPAMMVPTFFILIAPPAVGFLSYIALVGEVDGFARILFYVALFLFVLLVTQFKHFSRLQFTLSWWAYSFPTAALTMGAMVMSERVGGLFFLGLSYALLALLSLLILVLLFKTLGAIAHRKICQPH